MDRLYDTAASWLTAILDSTTDLIWSVDLERFALLTWNRAVESYYAAELHIAVRVGLTAADLVPGNQEFISSWEQRYSRARDEGAFTEVYQASTSLVLELNFSRIEERGTCTGLSVFGRNITDQVRAQQTLKENEKWFRALFDQSADAIFLNGLDGEVLRVNAEACRRLGYTAEELTRLRVHDFQSPEDRVNVESTITRLIADGHVLWEVTHVARDGRRIPTEVHSRVVEIDGVTRILSVARDISIRRRAQESFKKSEKRYELLFETSGTANAIFTADCRVLMANRAYGNLVGRKAVDLIGLSVEELFGPVTGEQFRRRAEAVMRDGKARTYVTDLAVAGSQRSFQTTYSPLQGEGQPQGLQVVAQDITEFHLLSEQIAQSEKFAKIGVLAGGIAHDFNNFLAGLLGYLDLARVLLGQNKKDEAAARLDKAVGMFGRAKALTQQLLTFSKGGAPVRNLHALAPLIRDWAGFALSGSDVSVVLDLAPDLWPCDCDNHQIGQVIDNLLINARQVSPSGGTISVRAENLSQEGPLVRIAITDQGPGISPALQKKIFEPFFTTRTEGTGLGLATSLSIIRQHQGRLEVVSEVGHGSTFLVYLPASPLRETATDTDTSARFQGSGWALVMDDQESIRDTLSETMTSMGYSVLAARNGHDALAYCSDAEEHGHPITVALLDLTIPGGSGGAEVARALRAAGSKAVLIAVSGYSEKPVTTGEGSDFDGFLPKPFSKNELARLLSQLL